jgi:DNA-binding transcriptional ArsR family regulator
MSKQVISNHLACLRGYRLVEAAKEGRHHWYRLADHQVGVALEDWLKVGAIVDSDCCSAAGRTCA